VQYNAPRSDPTGFGFVSPSRSSHPAPLARSKQLLRQARPWQVALRPVPAKIRLESSIAREGQLQGYQPRICPEMTLGGWNGRKPQIHRQHTHSKSLLQLGAASPYYFQKRVRLYSKHFYLDPRCERVTPKKRATTDVIDAGRRNASPCLARSQKGYKRTATNGNTKLD